MIYQLDRVVTYHISAPNMASASKLISTINDGLQEGVSVVRCVSKSCRSIHKTTIKQKEATMSCDKKNMPKKPVKKGK